MSALDNYRRVWPCGEVSGLAEAAIRELEDEIKQLKEEYADLSAHFDAQMTAENRLNELVDSGVLGSLPSYTDDPGDRRYPRSQSFIQETF